LIFVVLLVVLELIPGRPLIAQVKASLGQRAQIEGDLEIINLDYKDHVSILYFLKLQDGSHMPLRFLSHPPTHLQSGAHVRADGELSNGSLVLYSGNTSLATTTTSTSTVSTSASPVSGTLGPQSTLVILVNFQDSPVQPYSVADAKNAYFGTANSFFSENSYGQTTLTGDVVGWFKIPESILTCNMSSIATDAQTAAKASGVNLANYTRYVYAFPTNSACGWAGSSNVGGNPSQSWINGNTLDIHTIVHELGHAFGLWHSHLMDCGTSATIGTNCSIVDYGDPLDVMGVPQSSSAHYNAFQKERLGWLNYGNSPSIQTVQSSGTYTIDSYELGGTGPNALKILKSVDSTTGAKTWYYVEARKAVGFDAFLADGVYYTQNETNGVLFHVGTDGNGNSGDLLDMTPTTSTSSGWLDASLAVGQSFQDPAAGVTFTTTQVSSTGATIQVAINGSSVTPSLKVSTNQSSYNLGQTVGITVTAFNGSTPAAGVSVSVNLIAPNGQASSLKGTTGSNGSATLSYKLSRRSPIGTYQVQAATKGTGSNPTIGASTSFVVQ
jgi:M6 family metalloprotease-like protein